MLSTPAGMSAILSGNGRSTMDTAVSRRVWDMNGWLAAVEMTVTEIWRRRRRRAKWRSGIVCPLAMNGNKTICDGDEWSSEATESIFIFYELLFGGGAEEGRNL